MSIPSISLNSGNAIPQLGFGVFQVPPPETESVVTTALEAGYRSIDTAALYGNEAGVGRAVAASGIPREDLFITTKVWNDAQGYDSTLRAFDDSLSALGLDYVDLYLIHWPAPQQDRYVDTWRALIALQEKGLVRDIGVSNFNPPHLRRLIDDTGVVPVLNQVELHPLLQQQRLREAHAELGVVTEAWSPLAQGGQLLTDPVVTEIAERHGRSAAQVVIRWHLQLGNVVIPKSVTPSRIRENLDVFDFELSGEEMKGIGGLDSGARTGPDPDAFG